MRNAPWLRVLPLLLALPWLLAASPEKQVVADLRRDLAGDARTQRSLLTSERAIFLTQLETQIDTAESTTLLPLETLGVTLALGEFQTDILQRIDDDLSSIAGRGRQALDAYQVLVPAATALPVGIAFGDGGALDSAVRSYFLQLDKLYAPIHKRLAAYRKACETQSNVGVTLLVRPPVPRDYPGFDTSSFYGSYANLGIDVVAAASALGTAGDGVIAVMGSAETSGGNVTVQLNGTTFDPDVVVPPNPVTGRWLAYFDGPLDEASYVVRARQGDNGQWVSWHVGVR